MGKPPIVFRKALKDVLRSFTVDERERLTYTLQTYIKKPQRITYIYFPPTQIPRAHVHKDISLSR